MSKFFLRLRRALGEIEREFTPASGVIITSLMFFCAVVFVGTVLFVMSLLPETGLIMIGILLCIMILTFFLYGPIVLLLKVYKDWNDE